MSKRLFAIAVAACAAFMAWPAQALDLPPPAALRARLGQAPAAVSVLEPHLAVAGRMPTVDYLGFAAVPVLDLLLGPGWQRAGQEIEFRALDGFVSRVPVERFTRHRAWLVYARSDGQAFEVDNHLQGEKKVALGPYYLVWDNRHAKALQAEGGALWPYQVQQLAAKPSAKLALLPGTLAARHAAAAEAAQQYCLSCHQIRGHGGDKMPLDLSQVARGYDAARWRAWLLSPQTVRPGTTMPALPESMPLAEREALARRLLDYLKALPQRP